jgi:8-oxo-dGTP pyrophosphatase MutT (NUDIX family)
MFSRRERIEAGDQNPLEAAIRETCEELGLENKDIEVICPLDIVVSPFNAIIYPLLPSFIPQSN